MADPDEFLTVADVAAILKLNQQTVRKLGGPYRDQEGRFDTPTASRSPVA